MTIEYFVEQLRKEFINNRINTKTGWGKNDIEKEFTAAINTVLLAYVAGKHI